MTSTTHLKSGRPRETLLSGHEGQMTDAQLLAVLLRVGGGGEGAEGLAGNLLAQFGSLHAILDAPASTLLDVRYLGPAKVATLKACLGLIGRYARRRLESRPVFQHKDDVARFLASELGGEEREVFAGLFLDTRHHLIGFEKLFFGSVNRANVHPREVAKRALACNAAALVVAHNHPSGIAEPSAADIELTERLKRLLGELDVRLLDHVVVGADRVVSLAERGFI
ncbi:MAG: DNA repair protein RadC [Pseudomonadales bacterium]|nr:DNA repair protein RadC [Pseudomonadales bacterium]MDP6469439.1 DNA repair protein RadC [Pseudomonadales bacterium]MDP6827281.1 DNA repair protein RadC [Pseudomonadales bacterium]MDP6971104.1 DNA repair protein RadC [Pseudomonadales bacterium]